jgi:hypothetical protein
MVAIGGQHGFAVRLRIKDVDVVYGVLVVLELNREVLAGSAPQYLKQVGVVLKAVQFNAVVK